MPKNDSVFYFQNNLHNIRITRHLFKMKKTHQDKQITIRLSEYLLNLLNIEADKKSMSISELIRHLIRKLGDK